MATVWIVGRNHEVGDGWDLRGVFSTELKAISATASKYDWIGPMRLDETVVAGSIQAAYFPRDPDDPMHAIGLDEEDDDDE
jgi:hypothetical protein